MTGRFNPPSGWPQNGPTFNHGVVCGEGRTLHMTGQVAWDRDGKLIGTDDCEKQIRQCFEKKCDPRSLRLTTLPPVF